MKKNFWNRTLVVAMSGGIGIGIGVLEHSFSIGVIGFFVAFSTYYLVFLDR